MKLFECTYLQWLMGFPSSTIGWFLVVVTILLILRVLMRRGAVKEESLLVIRQLGVQLTTKYYSGKEDSQFIDNSKIEAVILNEGITCGKNNLFLP